MPTDWTAALALLRRFWWVLPLVALWGWGKWGWVESAAQERALAASQADLAAAKATNEAQTQTIGTLQHANDAFAQTARDSIAAYRAAGEASAALQAQLNEAERRAARAREEIYAKPECSAFLASAIDRYCPSLGDSLRVASAQRRALYDRGEGPGHPAN